MGQYGPVHEDDAVGDAPVADAPDGDRFWRDRHGRVLQRRLAVGLSRRLRQELALELGREEAQRITCHRQIKTNETLVFFSPVIPS